MGFLLRAAFWFSLVLLALPFNLGSDGSQEASVGPIQAFVAAREAVGDIAGICERKPDVCVTGKQAMHTIAERAKATVLIAAEMMDDDNEAATDTTADREIVTGSVPATTLDTSAGTIPVPTPAPETH